MATGSGSFLCPPTSDPPTDSSTILSAKSQDQAPRSLSLPISAFSDTASGEQFVAQHLVIDFTPSTKMDTEVVQQKCMEFWKLFERYPELSNLIVDPSHEIPPKFVNSVPYSDYRFDVPSLDLKTTVKSAISGLSLANQKGLETVFVPKCTRSDCTLRSFEFTEKKTEKPAKDSRSAKKLCQKMAAWNESHSKTSEGPGLTPTLTPLWFGETQCICNNW